MREQIQVCYLQCASLITDPVIRLPHLHLLGAIQHEATHCPLLNSTVSLMFGSILVSSHMIQATAFSDWH
jgi:hypothetical protein